MAYYFSYVIYFKVGVSVEFHLTQTPDDCSCSTPTSIKFYV